MERIKLIAYLRVSTQQQGKSGLGIEAQREAVERYAKTVNGEIIQEYQDIESGKHNDRPNLTKAIEHCKRTKSKLVIAKLDRLSRNAVFILQLRDSKVNFVCCDMPDANSLTIGIMAILAQDERERTSTRVKEALQAKKARGSWLITKGSHTGKTVTKLGNPDILKAQKQSVTAKRANNPHKNHHQLIINTLRQNGKTWQQIADTLNAEGYRTAENKLFTQGNCYNIHKRTAKPLTDIQQPVNVSVISTRTGVAPQ